ncbi:FecR domain-containing protein [Pseudoxanthomonas sp. CF125]|uniref:FecR family protein n=1 Tax=Pseudoxanthomonas sp. CF125 TaxID=1855303 RepID=UPI00087F78EA|nr:FecR domain-containing protein [Pseudoxanthomonas sp. CF125]SDQ96237.1 FecR family protein [Pseudoxanthomonas sp. CF125]
MASSKQIEQTAAAWLAKRDGGDWQANDQSVLDAWLVESTAHRVAFLRLEAAWVHSGRLKALGAGMQAGTLPARGQWSRAPSDRQTAGATADAGDSTASAAGSLQPPELRQLVFAPRAIQRPSRAGRYAGIAAGLALAVSLGWGWMRYTAVEQATYSTAMGSVRTMLLADGSQATLSSDSRIEVALSRGERRIDLQQGEAYFEVSKNPERPFIVTAGQRQVVAVGTRFAVRRDSADLRVVVTEGTVRLQPGAAGNAAPAPPTLLKAGSTALASSHGVLVRAGSVEDAERLVDWREGYLTFRDSTLADAAAEFNRYNVRKIVMGDPQVAALRVGGNFRWSNTDTFVRLLEQGFPVRAEQQPDRVILHSR